MPYSRRNMAKPPLNEGSPVPPDQWQCYCNDLSMPWPHTMGDHRLRRSPQ